MTATPRPLTIGRPEFITPVPKPRKKQPKLKQGGFVMPDAQDLSTAAQE